MSPGEGMGAGGQDPGAIRSRAEGLDRNVGAQEGWCVGMGLEVGSTG